MLVAWRLEGRKRDMARRRPTLTRRLVLAQARAFASDDASSSGWSREEPRLKARLRRRRARGAMYLTRAELVRIGEWKASRIRPLIARNTPAGVRGLTAAAFLTRDERLRIRLLQGLSGVGLPVASVILHFAEPARYPVYDVWVHIALRRLVGERFPPTPDGWVAYVACLQQLARRHRVSLRTLDKALWRLGKEGYPLTGRQQSRGRRPKAVPGLG
jgi:hypothetical protein